MSILVNRDTRVVCQGITGSAASCFVLSPFSTSGVNDNTVRDFPSNGTQSTNWRNRTVLSVSLSAWAAKAARGGIANAPSSEFCK